MELVDSNPFVQQVYKSKGSLPNFILYTEEQIDDFGKIQGISTENFKSKSFHFEGTQENACDFVIHDISSNCIKIPILNDPCMEQKFKQGETLGLLYTVDSSASGIRLFPLGVDLT